MGDGPASDGERGGRMAAFYERTSGTAYGLALRIAATAERAGAACEAAYLEVFAGELDDEAASELMLLDRVRYHALRIGAERDAVGVRSAEGAPAYTEATAIRAGLEQLNPLARRAIELAYFGGMSVGEIAGLLGQSTASVRGAMRDALLALGSLTRDEQETRR